MESKKASKDHEVAIALIQRDIEYIKTAIDGMGTLFAKQSDMVAVSATLKSISETVSKKADATDIAELHKKIDSKVEIAVFEPIQKTLFRINWLLISTVIIAVIALIIKK